MTSSQAEELLPLYASQQQCVDTAVCCSVRPWSAATWVQHRSKIPPSFWVAILKVGVTFVLLPKNYPSSTAVKKMPRVCVSNLRLQNIANIVIDLINSKYRVIYRVDQKRYRLDGAYTAVCFKWPWSVTSPDPALRRADDELQSARLIETGAVSFRS